MKKWILTLLTLTCTSAFAGDINLEVIGCILGKDVRVALYSSSLGFSEDSDGKNAFRSQVVKAESDTIKLSFPDLPVGKYAIAAFVDSNGNHKLDTNFLGIPVELYGFSSDARSPFKKPSFDAAAFEVGNESTVQVIHLK